MTKMNKKNQILSCRKGSTIIYQIMPKFQMYISHESAEDCYALFKILTILNG